MPGFGVLFVCVGNMCRSPFAERLLRHRLAEAGTAPGDFEVVSAGVMAPQGAPMSAPMRERLEQLGGSADGFASRQLQPPMVAGAGLVLTATRQIRSRVLEESPAALRRTFTVLEMAELAEPGPLVPDDQRLADAIRTCDSRRSTGHHERTDLVDPINQPMPVQDEVAGQLDRAVTAITAFLLTHPRDHSDRQASATGPGGRRAT